MKTEDLSTLKINKLTQAQYDKALQEGRINENELYLTPDNIGANGLPENAEFKNLTINDGYNGKIYLEGGNSDGRISAGMLSLGYKEEEGNYRLTYMPEDGIEMHQDNYAIYLIDGHIGLENENARAYINLNNELIEDIEVYLPSKSGTLATLDDIGSSGGSALDENGNLVIDDYNKGIVFSANDSEPAIYFDDDDAVRITPLTHFNSNVIVGDLNDTALRITSNNISKWVNENGGEYFYTLPDRSGTFVVADEYSEWDYLFNKNITIEGALEIYSDYNEIPNAPSTNDIDARFYAQGILLSDNDAESEYYLYFPQKTGTLATTEDISTKIPFNSNNFDKTYFDTSGNEENYLEDFIATADNCFNVEIIEDEINLTLKNNRDIIVSEADDNFHKLNPFQSYNFYMGDNSIIFDSSELLCLRTTKIYFNTLENTGSQVSIIINHPDLQGNKISWWGFMSGMVGFEMSDALVNDILIYYDKFKNTIYFEKAIVGEI